MRLSSLIATGAFLAITEANPFPTPLPTAAPDIQERAYTYEGWGVSGSIGANGACGAVLGLSGCIYGDSTTPPSAGTSTSISRTVIKLTTTTVPNTDQAATTYYASPSAKTTDSDGTVYASTKTYTSTANVVLATSTSTSRSGTSTSTKASGTAASQTSSAANGRVSGILAAAIALGSLGWLLI